VIAAEKNTSITFADKHFHVIARGNPVADKPVVDIFKDGEKQIGELRFPLSGSYQLKNLATTLAALDTLAGRGYFVPAVSLKKGLENVVENTGFQGRWQILGRAPLVIADGGHNADGIRQVVANVERLVFDKLRFVFGVVNDKDMKNIFFQMNMSL